MNRFRDGFFGACAEAGINRVDASALFKAAQILQAPADPNAPRAVGQVYAPPTLLRRLRRRPATPSPAASTQGVAYTDGTNAPSAMAKGAEPAMGDMDLRRKNLRIPFTRVRPRQLSNAQLAMFNANGANIRPMDGSPGAPRSYDDYRYQFPAEFRGGDNPNTGKAYSRQPWTQEALEAWAKLQTAKTRANTGYESLKSIGITPAMYAQMPRQGGTGIHKKTREFMEEAKAQGATIPTPTVNTTGARSWDVPPPPASTAANFRPRTFGRY